MSHGNTFFLFMDESFENPKTYQSCERKNEADIKFATLTGILIPINKLPSIQEKFYQLIKKEIQVEILPMDKIGKMLHGCKFMVDYDDTIKKNVLNDLVEIIISNKLEIVRICNFVSAQNRNFYYNNIISPSNMLIGKCFADMLSFLQNTLKESVIVPIIEDDEPNAQQKKNFSSLILSSHALLNSDFSDSCSMPYSKNMIEVLYSKKAYSLFTGLVDCISYFLRLKQLYSNDEKISSFQKAMINVINKIPTHLLNDFYYNLKHSNSQT